MTLPAIEFETSSNPVYSVIWLHGLGADGNDFVPVAKALNLPDMRFVFPHAPVRPVTLNGGYAMRAWYDIYALDLKSGEDREGILESRAQIAELVEREKERGIDAHRIFLAGFSQGGAIALYSGLLHPEKLAGILALSTYLPLADTAAREAHPANSATPVFMAHGVMDEIIPVASGLASKNAIENLGHEVEWHRYDMAHAVCQEEIEDIAAWFMRMCDNA